MPSPVVLGHLNSPELHPTRPHPSWPAGFFSARGTHLGELSLMFPSMGRGFQRDLAPPEDKQRGSAGGAFWGDAPLLSTCPQVPCQAPPGQTLRLAPADEENIPGAPTQGLFAGLKRPEGLDHGPSSPHGHAARPVLLQSASVEGRAKRSL